MGNLLKSIHAAYRCILLPFSFIALLLLWGTSPLPAAADSPWQNEEDEYDVNDDSNVNVIDAAILIDEYFSRWWYSLDDEPEGSVWYDFDVSGNRDFDVWDVIRFIIDRAVYPSISFNGDIPFKFKNGKLEIKPDWAAKFETEKRYQFSLIDKKTNRIRSIYFKLHQDGSQEISTDLRRPLFRMGTEYVWGVAEATPPLEISGYSLSHHGWYTHGNGDNAGSCSTCNGLEVTICGTEDDDEIVGTEGDDVIDGLGGFNVIDGKGGNDTICNATSFDNNASAFDLLDTNQDQQISREEIRAAIHLFTLHQGLSSQDVYFPGDLDLNQDNQIDTEDILALNETVNILEPSNAIAKAYILFSGEDKILTTSEFWVGFNIFAVSFGKSRGENGFDERVDFDDSGRIDFGDLSYLAVIYDQTELFAPDLEPAQRAVFNLTGSLHGQISPAQLGAAYKQLGRSFGSGIFEANYVPELDFDVSLTIDFRDLAALIDAAYDISILRAYAVFDTDSNFKILSSEFWYSFSLFASVFGTTQGMPRYDYRMDFDQSGVINFGDFGALNVLYGMM